MKSRILPPDDLIYTRGFIVGQTRSSVTPKGKEASLPPSAPAKIAQEMRDPMQGAADAIEQFHKDQYSRLAGDLPARNAQPKRK